MGERKRDPYAEVGQAMRQATARANGAGATYRDLAVLNAIVCEVGSYSWIRPQPISRGRLAHRAGMWHGDPEDCPKAILDALGARLKFLASCGAITYTPGGQKGGPKVGRIGYPPPATIAGGDGPRPPAEIAGGDTDAGSRPPAENATDPPRSSQPTPRDSDAKEAPTPRGNRGPYEDLRGDFRGGVRETRARPATTHAGDRAADRLTSFAPVALDPEQIAREARRVVEIAGQRVDVGVLLEALDDRDDPGTPAELLTWFAEWLGDGDSLHEQTAGAELLPIAHAFPVATVIADACTLTSGKPWTAHFDEAVRLAQHWQRHAYPEAITATVLAEIRHDGIRHPGDADDQARQAILELGTTPPKKFARALARKTA